MFFEPSVPAVAYVDAGVGVSKVVSIRCSLELFSEYSVDAYELGSDIRMIQIVEYCNGLDCVSILIVVVACHTHISD